MKRKIGLLLCIVTLLTSSGCMVKKEAGTTGETSNEITFEMTPEVTKEQTKEQPDVNNNSEDNKNTDNTNQNSTHPNPEPTPEFYDFMTLDPDVDIENEQIRDDILTRIVSFDYDKTPTFTKKENYLYEMYDKNYFTKSTQINFYIKLGTKGFYSPNTKKKLDNLGFKFDVSQSSDTCGYPYIYYHKKSPNCSKEEYVKRLEQALIILLEDHNVNYVNISYLTQEEK